MTGKRIIVLVIVLVFSFVSACSNKQEVNSNEEEKKVLETPTKDFSRIGKLKIATQTQELNRVVKILFYEAGDMQYKNVVAIDIGNKVMYLDPHVQTVGREMPNYNMMDSDIEQVRSIFQKYDIQKWKAEYSVEDRSTYEDGYGWIMYLEYADRTVEKHEGFGTTKSDVIPSNFNDFVDEIIGFVNTKK
ncbi:hypothetical protein HCA81_02050 [Listeria booriae]|uniref:hypothetical protein n=1 Tax=Listeria booriae TaxID=1552123 RepID=UPI001623CEBF|nr:hypothetical protein [Listeria booriae]MBC2019810.1 hypothetical protein [Listeria booriae]